MYPHRRDASHHCLDSGIRPEFYLAVVFKTIIICILYQRVCSYCYLILIRNIIFISIRHERVCTEALLFEVRQVIVIRVG